MSQAKRRKQRYIITRKHTPTEQAPGHPASNPDSKVKTFVLTAVLTLATVTACVLAYLHLPESLQDFALLGGEKNDNLDTTARGTIGLAFIVSVTAAFAYAIFQSLRKAWSKGMVVERILQAIGLGNWGFMLSMGVVSALSGWLAFNASGILMGFLAAVSLVFGVSVVRVYIVEKDPLAASQQVIRLLLWQVAVGAGLVATAFEAGRDSNDGMYAALTGFFMLASGASAVCLEPARFRHSRMQ